MVAAIRRQRDRTGENRVASPPDALARRRTATVRTRMHLQHVAPGSVQPCYDNGARHEPVNSLSRGPAHFKPGIGRSLGTLFGCFAALLDRGSDHTNRTKLDRSATRAWFLPHQVYFPNRHRQISYYALR